MKKFFAPPVTALLLATVASAQTTEPTPPPGSSTATSQWESMKKASEAEKAAYEAAKAAAEAQKASIEAKSAAARAEIGTVTGQAEIKGAVQAGSTPTKAEALLLVTQSTVAAAARMQKDLAPFLARNAGRDVLVLTDKAQLAVSDAVIFDLRREQLLESWAGAQQQFGFCEVPRPAAPANQGRGLPPIAAVGTAIDLAAKLGSYFMTDYSYGSIEMGDPSPELLAAAVVQSFPAAQRPSFIIPIHSLASDPTQLIDLLRPLHANYARAVADRELATKYAEAHRATSKAKAAACDAAAASLGKLTTGHEALMTALIAEPEGKEPLGVRIVRQKQIQKKLQSQPLILLLTGRQAAAYYTKKSLWTFLGGAPLYTMGGTSTTYTLFEPDSGRVLTGGAVAHHAGYRSVREVEKLFGTSAQRKDAR